MSEMIQHIRAERRADAPSLCGRPYVEPVREGSPWCPVCAVRFAEIVSRPRRGTWWQTHVLDRVITYLEEKRNV